MDGPGKDAVVPLQDHMKLISVDDHLIEPAGLWTDRLPSAMREAGPRVIEMDMDGQAVDSGHVRTGSGPIGGTREVWTYEGRIYPTLALNAVAGKKKEEYGLEPVRFDEILPGCYDPTARLADMDLDGIEAQTCFPSFSGFAGRTFHQGTDKDLSLACVQAYNDFILDEWCAAAPTRYISVIILPVWDVEASRAEILRCAAKNAKGISFPEHLTAMGLPSIHTDHWHPVFDAAQETSLPLAIHFGSAGVTPQASPDAPFPVMITLMSTNSMAMLTDWLFSPVLHRFPRLKVAIAEGGIGWIPYLLERADFVWDRHRYYTEVNREVPPSEVFRRNIWGCFIDDAHGVAARDEIGVDRITWECDYPHSDSNWPESRKRAAETLADVPDGDVHRIVELNARELFNFGV